VSWRGILGIPVAFGKDSEVLAWAEAMIGDPTLRSATASFTVERTDRTVLVNATGGAVTGTLPPAASCPGHTVTIKKTDASGNAVTVDGNASETIDGAANYPLTAQWNSVTVQSDGTNFVIIASV
jgi:hypothetical protein